MYKKCIICRKEHNRNSNFCSKLCYGRELNNKERNDKYHKIRFSNPIERQINKNNFKNRMLNPDKKLRHINTTINWQANNIENCREATRKWQTTYPEKARASVQKYIHTPRGKLKHDLSVVEHKNKLKNVRYDFEPNDYLLKVQSTKGLCPMCFKPFNSKSSTKRLTKDHEPPIKKVENDHIYKLDDMTPLCQSCNSSKNRNSLKIDFKRSIEIIENMSKK